MIPGNVIRDYFLNEDEIDGNTQQLLQEAAKIAGGRHSAAVREAFEKEYGFKHHKLN